MTKKADGTWRPCGDYRRLNMITEADHYPMPNIMDLTNNIGTARVFSKLDLLKGYFQVPVHPEDIPKTAITTPFGSYVFHYSTFGLRNSGATFQRMMDVIFGHLPFCAAYVDDILIYSDNHQDHVAHLGQVLHLLQENGLVVRPDKCVFGSPSVEFLGYNIDAEGIRPVSDKVEAIKRFPTPRTIKATQEFLGMMNYYHRFVPNAAAILTPLYDVISSKSRTLRWGQPQDKAFEAAKRALADATTLSHLDPTARLYLSTDASNVAVGAVLEQQSAGANRKPIAFFSRKLRPPQQKYSTFDRELLAIHLATRHFRHLLEGVPFTIRTDHKPLLTALTKSTDAWTARQQRHLSAIAETGCTIEYVPGIDNPVADALSRVEISTVQIGVDYTALANAQASDEELAGIAASTTTNLQLETARFGDISITCDVSTGRPRPFVPLNYRRSIFDTIHGLAHPSIRKTTVLMTEKFVWPRIKKDVRIWTRQCIACQRSKVQRHTKSPISSFPTSPRRFGHIHVDVVGPLPPSEGQRYLFTIIDRFTRWPEATPMAEANSASCAQALLTSWISRFGLPSHITSDRGSTFTSELWSALARLLGVQVHHTTAYHPQANGLVERFHRTLKAAIVARCTGHLWTHHLPWILLGLRTAPKDDIQSSPAETLYGQTLTVPEEFFPHEENAEISQMRGTVGQLPCRPTPTSKGSTYVPHDLKTCRFVFIRDDAVRPPLTPPYHGPYPVRQRREKAFQLEIRQRLDWVSIDRLKPAYVDETEFSSNIQTRSGRTVKPPIRLSM